MLNAHLLSVVAAAIAAFMVGGLWYAPLFGKVWMAEMGFTEADKAKVNPVRLFGGTLALELLSAFFLGHLLAHVSHSAQVTMMISAGMALGFVIPALLVNYMYAMKSAKLMVIDAGHWLVVYLVMGAVFVVLGV